MKDFVRRIRIHDCIRFAATDARLQLADVFLLERRRDLRDGKVLAALWICSAHGQTNAPCASMCSNSEAVKPSSSIHTARVCSPSRGARRTAPGVADSL